MHPDGPSVVAIGGGHGLARTLGAARRYAKSITAVVSVADDGGSSGRLRRDLAIPAPGDIRRALLALLPSPSRLGDALGYRFDRGELRGHALGNLLLAALAAECGSFVSAVEEACRILGTVGEVLPAAAVPVTLFAQAAGHRVAGQVAVMGERDITCVTLEPPDASAPDAVLDAIAAADQILVGPGSLYTSILAALAPVGIMKAIETSGARTIYLANLKEQVPETAGYDIGRHLLALRAHGFIPDAVLVDSRSIEIGEIDAGIDVVVADVADGNGVVHDELRLSEFLVSDWSR
ncbi:MAG TPA: uridine diphosphate-N-acetylglucosamine-binding protein YvcK [Acidimicrobiales bacterium]|nr:uridine diphosphate-N-acetylglucosamine-binding protein YvcK [Acidimicrobiales bacterium]